MLARLRAKVVAAGLMLLALTACASVPPEPPLPEVRLNLKTHPILILEYPSLIVAVFCGDRDAVSVTAPDGRRLLMFWARCTEA